MTFDINKFPNFKASVDRASEPYNEDNDYGTWLDFPSYDEMVRTFGDILVTATSGDWQGDYYYLLKDGDRYGFLTVGYGSCSGCDALQACDTKADLESLYDSLERGVQWKDSLAEAQEYLKTKDWTKDYSWYYNEFRNFLIDAAAALDVENWEPPELDDED